MPIEIKVDALSKVFGSPARSRVVALDNVTFGASQSDITGLVGPNGAGKTTTIKCLAGLVHATSGQITLGDLSVTDSPRSAAKHVAVVLEGNRNLYWRMTVRENIEFFAGLQGQRRSAVRELRDQLITRLGLEDKSKVPARMLSRGMQQKLALACALARQTEVVILDEPTLGLDIQTAQELRVLLRDVAEQRTVVISSHDMRLIEDLCDRVVVLASGKVVANDTVRNLTQLFGAKAYELQLAQVPDDLRSAMRRQFEFLVVEDSTEGVTEVRVEMPDSGGLYLLMELLRQNDIEIVRIESLEPNLEETYLRLTETRTGPR